MKMWWWVMTATSMLPLNLLPNLTKHLMVNLAVVVNRRLMMAMMMQMKVEEGGQQQWQQLFIQLLQQVKEEWEWDWEQQQQQQ